MLKNCLSWYICTLALPTIIQGDKALTEVIKLFSCSTQLSTKFILLINVKMPTIVGILTFISMTNTTSDWLKARNFFICRYFSFYVQLTCQAQMSWAWKQFYNLGASSTANIKALRGSLGALSVNKLSHIPKLQPISAVYENQWCRIWSRVLIELSALEIPHPLFKPEKR